ncbi:hypothetical protein [Chondromyces crocatus]|uniref:Secreted protein n=1 Tax=Chondromyces crocatus TaxID=52 RepID=A0A0K1EU62_CHOCO|nr:hypothetical protein [Chondromyces crocatus]AKT44187.1 uncharacterized protein CMC5_084270 [Chondromyces crocatus]
MNKTTWISMLAAGLFGLACGGNVVVDHDLGAGGAGGTGPGVGVGAGTPGTGSSGGLDSLWAACPEQAQQPLVCVAGEGGSLIVFSPGRGSACRPPGYQGPQNAPSIGMLGDYLYWCEMGQGVSRLSLQDGSFEIIPTEPCWAVTVWQDSVAFLGDFAEGPQLLSFYRNFDRPEERTLWFTSPSFFMNSVISGGPNVLSSAWHATSEIVHEVPPDFTVLPGTLMQGFDAWVDGLWTNEADRTVLVLNDGTIYVFHRDTGELLDQHPPGEQGFPQRGLHCWHNAL